MNDSFATPMRAGAPSGSPESYTDPKSIDDLLSWTEPEAVAASGRSYQKLAAAHEKIAGELLRMRDELHEAWRGKDASAAQSQLREVWRAATTVQSTANDFGTAVERHGSEYLAWYKYNKPASKDLPEAWSWMSGANTRIAQSWSAMPSDISTTLPPAATDSTVTGSTELTAAGGAAAPTASPSGRHGGTLPTGTPSHGGTHSSSGANLADFSSGPPPSFSSGLSPTGPGGGLQSGTPLPPGTTPGTGGLSGVGGGLGGVGGGLGSTGRVGGLGGVAVPSEGEGLDSGLTGTRGGATPESAAQNAAAAEEASAAEAGTAARSSGMLGPMIGGVGGGGNRQESEQTRRAWLAEDRETWSGEEASTGLIGNDQPEPEPEPEAPAEIDLSNEDEVAALLNELPDDPTEPEAKIAALRAKLARLESQVAEKATTDDDTGHSHGWMVGEDE